VWVQSQLLIWNFGQFNGQKIAWGSWKVNMFLEGVLWVTITVVTLIGFMKGKRTLVKALLMAVFFLSSVSVIISFLKAPERLKSAVNKSTTKGIFSFHREKNVLVILLDDFQSDYFNYIATNYPGEIKEMDGFTFYRNTISRFPTTKASLPSILTGSLYRNDKSYYNYVTNLPQNFNIFREYQKKFYSTSFVGQLECGFPDVVPMREVAYKLTNAYFDNLLEYLDYAAFRGLPTFIKPIIYNNGNWFFSFLARKQYPPGLLGADIRFLELFEKNVTVNSEMKGTFKFFHFFIPHAPWSMNENLKFEPGFPVGQAYIKQTRGAVQLASRILRTLKRAGIYDQTEIVILSDHGTGFFSPIDRKDIYYDALSLVPPCVQSSSLALLLHKPAHTKGKMVTSDIPLELTDLACLLGLRNNDSLCRQFNMARSAQERKRIFYYYEWEHEYWNSDKFPPMTEYIVSGPSYNPESYHLGNYIYKEKGIEKIPVSASSSYILGKEILFTSDGHGASDPYLRAGWSPAEPTQGWSDGPASGLSFKLEHLPRKDLILRLHGFAYLAHNKINCQVVTILVNHIKIGSWLVKEYKVYEAVIPKKIITDGSVNIVFVYSNPISPSAIEKSNDLRKLGIGVVSLVLDSKK